MLDDVFTTELRLAKTVYSQEDTRQVRTATAMGASGIAVHTKDSLPQLDLLHSTTDTTHIAGQPCVS